MLKNKPGGTHWYILAFMVLATSCNKNCNDPTAISYLAEQKAISYFECQRGDLLTADWNAEFQKLKLCTVPPAAKGKQGVIANLACPTIGAFAGPALVGIVIKPEYKCNPAKVGVITGSAITYLCELAPF